jgi:hypothetical protein
LASSAAVWWTAFSASCAAAASCAAHHRLLERPQHRVERGQLVGALRGQRAGGIALRLHQLDLQVAPRLGDLGRGHGVTWFSASLAAAASSAA